MLCSCSAWKIALRCSGMVSNSHAKIQKFKGLLSEVQGDKAHRLIAPEMNGKWNKYLDFYSFFKEPHPLWRVLLRWSLCRSGVEQHMDPFITDNQVARLSFRKEAAPHGYCSCALQSWALHRAGTDPGPSFCCFLLCEWAFSSHFITVSATREQLTCWLSWSTLATEMPLSREDSLMEIREKKPRAFRDIH